MTQKKSGGLQTSFRATRRQLRLEAFGDWLHEFADDLHEISKVFGLVFFCWLWVPMLIAAALFWIWMDRHYFVKKKPEILP